MAAAATTGCVHTPLPIAMTPPQEVALREPLSLETLAVLDFVDARPAFERSELPIDESLSGSRVPADDRFWSFHAEDPTLPQDPAAAPDWGSRVTGTQAFAWYPFPHHGIGKPVVRPVGIGVADYLALEIEQRGVFANVIRVRNADEARVAGAQVILSGRIDRFGSLLAVVDDRYVVRPDDWVEFRLLSAAAYDAELRRVDGAAPLLARSCVGRVEDRHPSDKLNGYAGNQAVHPYYRLDATDFPAYAAEDMAVHARRALEQATAPLMSDLEQTLQPATPSP
jgi:hypothetical protein